MNNNNKSFEKFFNFSFAGQKNSGNEAEEDENDSLVIFKKMLEYLRGLEKW